MNNALNSWNPLRELEDFQKRILGAFQPTAPLRGEGNDRHPSQAISQWLPLVDITEDSEGYHITAELPEVNKDDVKITLENKIITITGERKSESEKAAKKYHRIERSYGCFARSFGLPDDADPAQVEARFADGLLRIRVGKSEAAKPKQIEVKVS
jgi:HSP20 family protein